MDHQQNKNVINLLPERIYHDNISYHTIKKSLTVRHDRLSNRYFSMKEEDIPGNDTGIFYDAMPEETGTVGGIMQ
jgi:hypothetical protein